MRVSITYLLHGETHETVLKVHTEARTAKGKNDAVTLLFSRAFADTGAILVSWVRYRRSSPPPDSQLHSALQEALQERGLDFSPRTLSKLTGLSEATTRALHDGGRPSPETLRLILNGLGIEGEARGRWWRMTFDGPV